MLHIDQREIDPYYTDEEGMNEEKTDHERLAGRKKASERGKLKVLKPKERQAVRRERTQKIRQH